QRRGRRRSRNTRLGRTLLLPVLAVHIRLERAGSDQSDLGAGIDPHRDPQPRGNRRRASPRVAPCCIEAWALAHRELGLRAPPGAAAVSSPPGGEPRTTSVGEGATPWPGR